MNVNLDWKKLEPEAFEMARVLFQAATKMHEEKGRNFLKFIEGMEAYEVTSMAGAFLICIAASGISDESYRQSMIDDRFEMIKSHLPQMMKMLSEVGLRPDIGPRTEN